MWDATCSIYENVTKREVLNAGLAKKFIRISLRDGVDKPKRTFWPAPDFSVMRTYMCKKHTSVWVFCTGHLLQPEGKSRDDAVFPVLLTLYFLLLSTGPWTQLEHQMRVEWMNLQNTKNSLLII